MTETEFQSWYVDYCRTFPSVAKWLNDLDASDRGAKDHQKRTWFNVLASVELRDARAATLKIACGDEPAIAGYERELTAAAIRRIAGEISADREARVSEACRRETLYARRAIGDGGISLGGIFRDVTRLLDRGGTIDEGLALINSRFPPLDPQAGRRYRCRTCLDTRVVYVWAGVSIRAVLEGQIQDRRRRKACVADCCCAREAREKVLSDKQLAKFVYYDETKHCACPRGDVDSQANISELVAWVEHATSVQGRPNYAPEFDEYNNRD